MHFRVSESKCRLAGPQSKVCRVLERMSGTMDSAPCPRSLRPHPGLSGLDYQSSD